MLSPFTPRPDELSSLSPTVTECRVCVTITCMDFDQTTEHNLNMLYNDPSAWTTTPKVFLGSFTVFLPRRTIGLRHDGCVAAVGEAKRLEKF
jgi:hypothetical protein